MDIECCRTGISAYPCPSSRHRRTLSTLTEEYATRCRAKFGAVVPAVGDGAANTLAPLCYGRPALLMIGTRSDARGYEGDPRQRFL